jgi:hypothetical protein
MMNKRVLIMSFFCLALCLIFNTACNLADNNGGSTTGPNTYTLTVSVGEGVTGSPTSGTYSYTEGDTVSYTYNLQSGYINLAITLDGNPVASSGTINMLKDRILNATAEKSPTPQYDIRGTWNITIKYPSDVANHKTFIFSGNLNQGTLQVDFPAVQGPYTVTNSNVSFSYSYVDGDSGLNVTHSFTGSFTSANAMSGNCTKVEGSNSENGTWSATR